MNGQSLLLFGNDQAVHWETKADPDYQRVFPDMLSPANIWNISDDKSDKEESISNYYTLYSGKKWFFISSWWNEREKDINTVYAETGWMLCVIIYTR